MKTKVIQYNSDMDFVQEFESMQEASKVLNLNVGCISLCCNGKAKRVGGYYFSFKDFGSKESNLKRKLIENLKKARESYLKKEDIISLINKVYK